MPETSAWVSAAKGLCRDEREQDLVEYALRAGFVAIAGSVSSIFSKVMAVLDRFS